MNLDAVFMGGIALVFVFFIGYLLFKYDDGR